MKHLITFLFLLLVSVCFGGISSPPTSGGGTPTFDEYIILTKDGVEVGKISATTNGIQLEVKNDSDAWTNQVSVSDGSFSTFNYTLQDTEFPENYITSVYSNGVEIITEIYNGTTNTYYDLTD